MRRVPLFYNVPAGSTCLILSYYEGLSDRLSIKRKDKKPSSVPPSICRVPQSSVLSSVKNFLPLMREANKKLETVPPEEIDIESVTENDQQVIEMNLALFEQSSDDEYSDSSIESSDEEQFGEITEDNIKLTKQKQRKPNIEVVDSEKEKG